MKLAFNYYALEDKIFSGFPAWTFVCDVLEMPLQRSTVFHPLRTVTKELYEISF